MNGECWGSANATSKFTLSNIEHWQSEIGMMGNPFYLLQWKSGFMRRIITQNFTAKRNNLRLRIF